MSTPMEERLRAHYAERTEREALPGPDTEESLSRFFDRMESPMRPTNVRRFPTRPLLVAAAILVVCAIAGVVVARIDDDNRVSTTPDDDRPTPSTTAPPTTASTPTTVPTPDSTAPPALPTVSSKALIVGEWGALGWWDGTRWVPADYNQYVDGGVPLAGNEEYQIIHLDGSISTSTGGRFENSCFNDDADVAREIDLGIGPSVQSSTAPIAVNGVANPLPRLPRALDASAGPYRAEASEVLAGLGITDPDPNISKVVAADLDGDGADEVIVAADRLSDPRSLIAEEGDYSLVFVRHGDGSGRTVVAHHLAQGIENQTPYVVAFAPAAVADLNGDGRMELVVEGDYYEGVGVGVHEYRPDGTLPEVLQAGCGA